MPIGNFGNGYDQLGLRARYRLVNGSKSGPEQDLSDSKPFAQAPLLIMYYARNTLRCAG